MNNDWAINWISLSFLKPYLWRKSDRENSKNWPAKFSEFFQVISYIFGSDPTICRSQISFLKTFQWRYDWVNFKNYIAKSSKFIWEFSYVSLPLPSNVPLKHQVGTGQFFRFNVFVKEGGIEKSKNSLIKSG